MVKKPIKVYLDHKDYVQISKSRLGIDDCKAAEHFKFLNKLVDDNRIEIFFSIFHILESTNYAGKNENVLDIYSRTIDSLTNTKCILYPIYIEENEIINFIKIQNNHTKRITDTPFSPYGKGFDAFPKLNFERLSKQFDTVNIPKKLVRQALPKIEETLPTSNNFWSSKHAIDLFSQTKSKRKKALKKFYKSVFNFKNLTTYYKTKQLNLENLLLFFKPAQALIVNFIKNEQLKNNKDSIFNNIDKFSIEYSYVISKKLREEINLHFSGEEKTHMTAKMISEMGKHYPGIHFYNNHIETIKRYLLRNKGGNQSARKPSTSDINDIRHSYCIPYVDFFSTDRFFKTVVSKHAKKFGTTVVSSLEQLTGQLELIL